MKIELNANIFISTSRRGDYININFQRSRLKQLAWRYLHRNHPEKRSSLESEEQWNNFVQKRLTTIPEGEDKTYIEENISKIKRSQKNLGLTSRDEKVLNELEERINLLQAKYL